MKKVEKGELHEIARLFGGIPDSMVIACLQGSMGDAYVDKLPSPSVGVIVSGEYSFFAGDTLCEEASFFAENLFEFNPASETVCIFPEDEPEWESVLLAASQNKPKPILRYRIAQRDYIFDEKLLGDYLSKLPVEYKMVRFDEGLYQKAMAEDWSKEFCETFDSAADYLTRGFGYAAICGGHLAAGTSTMTVYDGGAEVQVATHPDHRGKGLAMACASAFIMECQRRGIRACWDAANQISKKMAISLGYEYQGEYVTIHMEAPSKCTTM